MEWGCLLLDSLAEGDGMTPDLCPPAQEIRKFDLDFQSAQPGVAPGYGARLMTTSMGPPVLPHWCVWVEPPPASGENRWTRRWWKGVDAALETWSREVSLTQVMDPKRAHIRVERRRPPRRQLPSGWRASNGRTLLETLQVRRDRMWRLEPRLTVLVSPELRAPVLQATALHELGHALGLWGHSDQSGDAMAVTQGQAPVLTLSDRDRLTFRWLQQIPTRFGSVMEPQKVP